MTSNLWLLRRTRPMCSSVSELPMPTSSNSCTLTGMSSSRQKYEKVCVFIVILHPPFGVLCRVARYLEERDRPAVEEYVL